METEDLIYTNDLEQLENGIYGRASQRKRPSESLELELPLKQLEWRSSTLRHFRESKYQVRSQNTKKDDTHDSRTKLVVVHTLGAPFA
jgi:hypothetical protein